jgi:hypothetical protein
LLWLQAMVRQGTKLASRVFLSISSADGVRPRSKSLTITT